jgi:hypothetical protein
MASNYPPRLSPDDYRYCLGKAAKATSPEEVQRLRTAVLRRWRGDPHVVELANVLYSYEERLAARERTLRRAAEGRAAHCVRSRIERPLETRTSGWSA